MPVFGDGCGGGAARFVSFLLLSDRSFLLFDG
jgi:hypothetical protein